MPSGLRVTRIDRAPFTGAIPLIVNGMPIGGILHRTMVELTVAPGDLLLEVMGPRPLVQLLRLSEGLTTRVRIGRRCNLGIMEVGHYMELEPPLAALPDRTLFPLNLSARSALQWLQQKRALGEPLTPAQSHYLLSHLPPEVAPVHPRHAEVPSLAELGAFAALGLESDAGELDVREAFRLLVSIHTPETGQRNETLLRLEEAFRIAMQVVTQRAQPGIPKIGR